VGQCRYPKRRWSAGRRNYYLRDNGAGGRQARRWCPEPLPVGARPGRPSPWRRWMRGNARRLTASANAALVPSVYVGPRWGHAWVGLDPCVIVDLMWSGWRRVGTLARSLSGSTYRAGLPLNRLVRRSSQAGLCRLVSKRTGRRTAFTNQNPTGVSPKPIQPVLGPRLAAGPTKRTAKWLAVEIDHVPADSRFGE